MYPALCDSGNTNTRHFCPACGSRVYGENSARPGVVGIAVGCVDDNEWFSPHAVVYAGCRPGWDVTSEEVPNFDTMPPPPAKKLGRSRNSDVTGSSRSRNAPGSVNS